jgi:hypothetical protein
VFLGIREICWLPKELVEKDKVLILGRPPNRIDVLTKPDGISWEACWSRRVASDYAGEPIAYLSLEDLVASKLAAARDQDPVDVKKLRVIADSTRATSGPRRGEIADAVPRIVRRSRTIVSGKVRQRRRDPAVRLSIGVE